VTAPRLDHVAIAVERWTDAWPCYAVDLGGEWRSGERGPGFAPQQLEYANGMRVELLEPNRVAENDFLRRFLDRHGPGVHHLTFKVHDIAATLAALDRAGFHPVGVDTADPTWKEAFVHPKEAAGVVVQVAEAVGGAWVTPAADGFPVELRPSSALTGIVLAVADLDDALRLYRDVLGGKELRRGRGSVELGWEAPATLTLVEAAAGGPPAAWLDGRSGRVRHLTFACPDPRAVASATPAGDGNWAVESEHANGVRLILSPG